MAIVIAFGLALFASVGAAAGLVIEGWLRARRERRERARRWLALLRREREPVDFEAGRRIRARLKLVLG